MLTGRPATQHTLHSTPHTSHRQTLLPNLAVRVDRAYR